MAQDPNTTDLSDDIISTIPSNQGQSAVSGSEPDPDSDDDTLQNAQTVGTQLREDEEHPQEIDIARDVNNAEKAQRNE